MEGKNRYRCPECKELETLSEEVTIYAWRVIDEYLEPDRRDSSLDYDDDTYVHGSGLYSCYCGWQGGVVELEKLGIDDEPLPVHSPNQLKLDSSDFEERPPNRWSGGHYLGDES